MKRFNLGRRLIPILLIPILSALAVAAAGVRAAHAEPIPRLTQFLADEIASADLAVDSAPPAFAGAEASFDEAWYYRRFWLRVRTPAGIEVPWIFKVQIIPEVELLWEREYPEGWGTYKPAAG